MQYNRILTSSPVAVVSRTQSIVYTYVWPASNVARSTIMDRSASVTCQLSIGVLASCASYYSVYPTGGYYARILFQHSLIPYSHQFFDNGWDGQSDDMIGRDGVFVRSQLVISGGGTNTGAAFGTDPSLCRTSCVII